MKTGISREGTGKSRRRINVLAFALCTISSLYSSAEGAAVNANYPSGQPTKFELMINLKAAKQLGLIIPPNVLGASGSSRQMTVLRNEC